MNDLLTLLEAHPVLAAVLPVLIPAIPMTLLFSYAGLGFMVGALQVIGARSGRSAYDKAARQLATLALILGWILLVTTRIWIFFSSDSYVPQSMLATLVELSWGIFGFSVIATSIHFAVWKPLANHRILHGVLAFLVGYSGIVAVFAVLAALRLVAALDLPNAASLSLIDLFDFSVVPSPLITATAFVVPLALSLSAAAGLVWLLIRRKRDDFGRDYYNTMTAWCARWGLWTTIVVTLLAAGEIFLAVRDLASVSAITPLEGLGYAAHLLPLLAACLIFGLVARSPLPLRLKPWIVVAFLLCAPAAYFVYTNATSFVF